MAKKILIGLLIVFVVMQFFQPKRNISEVIPDTDFIIMNNPPEEVVAILKTSCYDCHSNNTSYPWYNKVAPVSYILANHVNEGKEHLNFSEWGTYNDHQKEHASEEIMEEIEEHHMPLKSYISMHKDAVISEEEIKILKSYFETHLAMSQLKSEKPQ